MSLIALLPAPVHRLALKVAEQVRRRYWRIHKPELRGVALVVFDERGHVLLVRHSYRMRNEWHLPTGGCGRRETPEHTAHRELGEETGLSAQSLRAVGTDRVDLHGANNTVTIFAVQAQGEPRADGREIDAIAFHDPDALPSTVPQWARNYIERAQG